jgi:hypothetical protein
VNSSQFKACRELHLQNGDQCQVGQFVISKDPHRFGATVVARVEEILQLKNSIADFSGMPDYILLQAADVSRSATTYHMPHIDLTNKWALVTFQVCLLVRMLTDKLILLLIGHIMYCKRATQLFSAQMWDL